MLALILGTLFILPGVAGAGTEIVPEQTKAPTRPIKTGEVPHIDVYTMGVGTDFTEAFGHAAVCTRYEQNPRNDRCYNYGTTNFENPADVGWRLLRGQSRFWVSVISPHAMMDFYQRSDRTVWVQELHLPDAQALAIANKLHFDSLEENRYYRYHHYFDNCTTRIRDILDENTDGALRRDSDKGIGSTLRDLSRRGFAGSPLLLGLSDYVLGRVGDHEPTLYEAMFLPAIFQEVVRTRFDAEPMLLYERRGPEISQSPGPVRLVVLAISLLLVAPLWLGFRRRRISRLQMVPALLVLSLLGLLLWSLAAVSPLPMARYNEALLLFFPLDFLLLLLGGERRRRYAQVRVVITLLAVAAAGLGLLQQPLWAIAALPVLALLPIALLAEETADVRA